MIEIVIALLLLPGLVIGLTIHEFAHAWVASLLGDQYPRRQGRVSVNPFRHLSLFGTLAIFVLRFGWGKPVQVNLYNFKHPKRDYLLCSLAGPAANVLVVGACILLMLFTRGTYRFGPNASYILSFGHMFLGKVAMINAILAAVNLLPVPPLDGSKIWPCLIPHIKPTFSPKTTWVFVAVLVVLLYTDTLAPVFQATFNVVGRILPESDETRCEARLAEACWLGVAGKHARAEEVYTDVLNINPDSGEAYEGRARSRVELGKYSEALEDMNQAIERNSANPEYYQYRATLLEWFGRREEAQADRDLARSLGGAHNTARSRPTTRNDASRPKESKHAADP